MFFFLFYYISGEEDEELERDVIPDRHPLPVENVSEENVSPSNSEQNDSSTDNSTNEPVAKCMYFESSLSYDKIYFVFMYRIYIFSN